MLVASKDIVTYWSLKLTLLSYVWFLATCVYIVSGSKDADRPSIQICSSSTEGVSLQFSRRNGTIKISPRDTYTVAEDILGTILFWFFSKFPVFSWGRNRSRLGGLPVRSFYFYIRLGSRHCLEELPRTLTLVCILLTHYIRSPFISSWSSFLFSTTYLKQGDHCTLSYNLQTFHISGN